MIVHPAAREQSYGKPSPLSMPLHTNLRARCTCEQQLQSHNWPDADSPGPVPARPAGQNQFRGKKREFAVAYTVATSASPAKLSPPKSNFTWIASRRLRHTSATLTDAKESKELKILTSTRRLTKSADGSLQGHPKK